VRAAAAVGHAVRAILAGGARADHVAAIGFTRATLARRARGTRGPARPAAPVGSARHVGASGRAARRRRTGPADLRAGASAILRARAAVLVGGRLTSVVAAARLRDALPVL